MSIAAELKKLQERRAALADEIAAIDRELESVALSLGVKFKPANVSLTASLEARPKLKRGPHGEAWERISFWLQRQSTAQTALEIAQGSLYSLATVHAQLSAHRDRLIHRGSRWGVSESQFADHSADLEEQRHGDALKTGSTLRTAPSLNGQTATLNPSTTTANTVTDPIEPARNGSRGIDVTSEGH